MRDTMQLATIDQTISNLRAALRERVAQDPQSFGGHDNPRLAITIGEHAPLGSIGVPSSLDISTTQGLMGAIDLTLLDRSATMADIEAIATRAKHESAAAVCVYPEHVPPVQRITGGCPPAIAVVGFPSVPDPMSTLSTTLQETRLAIRHGAKEIDMVLAMNFKDPNPNDAAHYHYIQQVVSEAAKSNVPVKVILETAYLTDAQKIRACLIAKLAGAAYVKTSTGFALEECMRPELDKSQKGATAHDVALMRRAVGDTTCDAQGHTIPMGVKASGGVRTREQAMAMYEAGASRIGASGSIDVRSELEKQMARRHAAPTRTAAGGIGGY